MERGVMIVAGFGFRRSATIDSLRSAYELATQNHDVTTLATADDKARAPCFTALATSLALPVHAISPVAIAACKTTTQSPRVLQERATGSLAEAAALAAAGAGTGAGTGAGARLIAPRQISQDGKATCALALTLAIGDDP
ncbi:MAG: cobalamin biosynthesis protein [Rhodobacteraceae bacterium]|nr:cobalamin biosynthesis protein [Paracoccaceae bacterium]